MRKTHLLILSVPVVLTSFALLAGTGQPDETLPGFKANQVYHSAGVDHVNLFNGDPGIVIPLGPEYPLSSGLTWQLRATYTSKFWTYSTVVLAEQKGEIQHAYVSGYPTLGVGWGLHLGFVDGDSYVSPTTGRHYFNGVTFLTRDGSGLRRSGNGSSQQYKVEFPDGSKHVFGQKFYRPRPNPEEPFQFHEFKAPHDFSDDEYAADNPRWGLTEIWDRFGKKVLTVEYVGSDQNNRTEAWKIWKIHLAPPDASHSERVIVWNWLPWTNSISQEWPVLDSIEFPSVNGTLTVYFDPAIPGTSSFVRNSYDTSCYPNPNDPDSVLTDSTVDGPQLAAIRMNGNNGRGTSEDLAKYSFLYNRTVSGNNVANGTLRQVTLPTGGIISYTYSKTAGHPFESMDLETIACPLATLPMAPESQLLVDDLAERFRKYVENSAAVATRTETVPGFPPSSTNYCRNQAAPPQGQSMDDSRVARSVVVLRPDGNENMIATRYIFSVQVQHNDGEPSNAGLELERRYYAGPMFAPDDTHPKVDPIRTLVFCYDSDGPDHTHSCGYRNIDGSMASLMDVYNIRRQKEVTWYGVNPDIGGGDCGQAPAPDCWQRASLDWNGNALEYGTERISSNSTNLMFDDTAPTTASGRYRDLKTAWSPSISSSNWLLKLYSSKTTEDHFFSGGCPYVLCTPGVSGCLPCTATTNFSFDSSNGFLKSVSTTDATYGSVTHSFAIDDDRLGNPTTETLTGTGTVSGSFVTNRTFQSGLPLTSVRSGLAVPWSSFNVDRDPATGQITRSRDPNGLETVYEYDALGRVTRIHPPGGEADTTYCYVTASGTTGPYILARKGAASACATDGGSAPDDSGSFEAYLFDGMGRLVREFRREPNASPGSSYIAFRETTYNAAGLAATVSEWAACPGTTNVVSCFASPASSKTIYSNFDFLGRPRLITLPDNSVVTKSFDDGSILNSDFTEFTTVSKVNGLPPNGFDAVSGIRKDILGRVSIATDPGQGNIGPYACYRYNVLDKLAKVEIPCESDIQTRKFSYDSFGFLRSETHPEKGTTSYSAFDALGNPRTMQEGIYTHSSTYDAAGRLLTLSIGGQSYIENSYDGAPGPTAGYPKGRLTRRIGRNPNTASSFSIQEDFTYAGLGGRLSDSQTTISPPTGPPAILVSERWVHNPLGLVQTHFHPRRATDPPFAVSTGYRSGKPVLVVANGIPVVKSVAYHPSGALASYTTGNGTNHDVTTTISTDLSGMPRPRQFATSGARTSGGAPADISIGPYTYDGAGNILAIGSDTFAYDAVSRLAGASLSGAGSQAYSYDLYGNLVNRAGQNPISLGCAPLADPGICIDFATNRLKAYSYDSLGNLTNPPGEWIAYDALSRATSVTASGNTYSYYYTGGGERILKVLAPSASTYTFRDADNRVATEYAGTTPSRDNVFLGNLLVGSYSNNAVSGNGPSSWLFYSSDHLGTPRLLTDSMGVSVETRRSWPFGEDVTIPQSPQPFQRLRFATMERDPEGQRYYDHARSHSFGLARFLCPDKLGGKIEDPQSWNRYTYSRNNPLKYVDLDGNAISLAPALANANRQTRERAAAAILNSNIPGRDVLAGVSERLLSGFFPEHSGEVATDLPMPGMAIAESVLLGKEGEVAAKGIATSLGESFGGKLQIPSLTRTAARRFPDGMTSTMLSEVKNAAYVRFTNQLKDFLAFAEKNGQQFTLYVRSEGTKLTRELEELVKQGRIVVRYLEK